MAVSNTFSRFQVFDGCRYQKPVGFVNSVTFWNRKRLLSTLTSLGILILDDPVGIFTGIDGVPLTKSSGSQFWVIVGYLPFVKDFNIIFVLRILKMNFC